MPELVVVAKTRMGNLTCVGAVNRDTGDLIRLLPDTHLMGWPDFSFEIGEALQAKDLRPAPSTVIEPPHVEDHIVTGEFERLESIKDLNKWIKKSCPVWEHGGPNLLFEGCLGSTKKATRYLEEGCPLPSGSVGFWILSHQLELEPSEDGKFRYIREGEGRLRIKYVGLDPDPPPVLHKGTLVRLSLARWYRFEPNEKRKCWLQLSGWYP